MNRVTSIAIFVLLFVVPLLAFGTDMELPDDADGQKLFPDKQARKNYWEENSGKLRVICDPRTSNFELESAATERPIMVSSVKPIRFIQWNTLMIMSKKETKGYFKRLGTRTKTLACGHFTFSVSAGADSDSAGGFNGVFEYPLVDIYYGKTLVLPKTLLNVHEYQFKGCENMADCPVSISGSVVTKSDKNGIMLRKEILVPDTSQRAVNVQTIPLP